MCTQYGEGAGKLKETITLSVKHLNDKDAYISRSFEVEDF